MRWTDEMRIETPEQIGVDLELAGLGTRFLAQVVDWFWKVLLTIIVIVGILFFSVGMKANPFKEANTLFIAIVVGGMYLLWFGYGVYFEMRWNGQTPGKKFVKIRVVQQNGAPIDARAACIRNLLAVADFLPAFQMLGALLILLTANRQRLGDLAAGTIVVRERAAGAGPETADELLEYVSTEYAFTPTQLCALTPADRGLIRSFLQRFRQMVPRGRERLAFRMVDRLIEKMEYRLRSEIADDDEARTFLASLLRDYEEFLRNK